MSQEKLIFEIL